MRRYKLEFIVFVCGAAVMILEMVGSRIVAPYLGTSLIVWTGIIGVILASLSIGYAWGGKLADKNPTFTRLSQIIILSAFSVLVLATIQLLVLVFFSNSTLSLYWQTIFVTIILFAPSSILLGMISPYAVRLKMKDVATSGALVGNLYAISTVGSIVGTFLAGFVLMAFFNHIKILLFIGIALVLVSFLSDYRSWRWVKLFAVIMFFSAFAFDDVFVHYSALLGLRDINTSYNRVLVQDIVNQISNRPVRLLKTDKGGFQSAIYLDSTPAELVAEYNKYYDLAKYFNPNLNTVLTIGGAAYNYPRHFLEKFPSASMDVVEIDPGMTKIAQQYFSLKPDDRLNVFHEDGRVYLNKNKKSYDAIFVDAFSSWYAVPHHLTTLESARAMYRSMSDGGVVTMNLISAIDGDGGKFFRAEYRTLKVVFPQVYVFRVYDTVAADQVQNIILLATKSDRQMDFKSDDVEMRRLLSNLYTKNISEDVPVLTDNYAPVESYLAKLAMTKI